MSVVHIYHNTKVYHLQFYQICRGLNTKNLNYIISISPVEIKESSIKVDTIKGHHDYTNYWQRSTSIDQHFKHLRVFLNVVKENDLVLSKTNYSMFQINISFLGHNIKQGTIVTIQWSIQFVDKFSAQIFDKTQLQRFLGCVNYIADFIPSLINLLKISPLKKPLPPWTDIHSKVVRELKLRVKDFLCLSLTDPSKIAEADASDIGYGGILK